jgi:hypothetical protein
MRQKYTMGALNPFFFDNYTVQCILQPSGYIYSSVVRFHSPRSPPPIHLRILFVQNYV